MAALGGKKGRDQGERGWIGREKDREGDREKEGSSEAAALADSGGARERVQMRLGLGGIRALGQKVKWLALLCWAKGRLGREKERASLES